ncbi:Protein of unknown function (DUF3591) [Teratosphaeria destructans]|uniref:Transcription initiation factor TFIID subunit 1 histone acetyltransferase domain-containing protein n=1 Tax=Teratosphaeria destructans TaxID=418781 RepID=A0A9W7W152_9PEZI|nr:Protein of unknown function (DUF3591) [Teratosphaeria destructans]
MPHATEDEIMGGMDSEVDEEAMVRQFLQNQDPEGGAGLQFEGAIDQTDKADDAYDFENEDFDDDELPEEEQAGNKLDADSDNFEDAFAVDPFSAPATNGFHTGEHASSDDLFGGEEHNDLFGEHLSSPEQERQPVRPQAPPKRTGGLALPSKSGLVLPGQAGTYRPPPPSQHRARPPQQSSASMAPRPHQNGYAQMSPTSMDDSDDDDPEVVAQRKLFKAHENHLKGAEMQHATDEDWQRFFTLFPEYSEHYNPRFTEIFPQRHVQYRGKVPLKPPKPVQPTKLSLDVLQDQERSFKSSAAAKQGNELLNVSHIVYFQQAGVDDDASDDGLVQEYFSEDDVVGGLTIEDMALICQDWSVSDITSELDEDMALDGWEAAEQARPTKKRKLDILEADLSAPLNQRQVVFDEPEKAIAKVAKTVALDLNDPLLLIDEHAPQHARRTKRMPGDVRRDAALARDLARRYNISNDEAYDLLKENHQHKVRSMLGGTVVEHSLPATKLQYPFYRVALDPKAKRSFHRPTLDLRLRNLREELRTNRLRIVKKKERRGKDIKELFATAEKLALDDNANVLLLEYSEEAPMMLSNFGMGNKLINFYRKRNPDDQERPKRDIGETNVLLTQDKSPFANFGHVNQGEIVPTIQNGLFRAPVFQHASKPTDFLVAISTTHSFGSKMYLRNVENLHTVGQQLPISEVPTEHSRRVTEAAKKRLRAIAYRIYLKSLDPSRSGKRKKQLDNASIMAHLKGHDMPQTRSKMREFMAYDKGTREIGVWVPKSGQPVPDIETLRGWIKPEDLCLLESMQVGVQRLADLGLKDKDNEDEKEVDGNVEVELAPWRATKNFIGATQGKAMLKLHGEGDPTRSGEGFSFVKTSMKGGFQPVGLSVEDTIKAKKRRETGGHSYNVAEQQKAYDEFIRQIWNKQKQSLSSAFEREMPEEDDDMPSSAFAGRAGTPRSSFAGTPARRDDETGTQFSKGSANRGNGKGKVLVIRRTGGRDQYGQPLEDQLVEVTNPKVIREYRRRRNEKRLEHIDINAYQMTGEDPELEQLVKEKLQEEYQRIKRNVDRREARERLKNHQVGGAGSPPASNAGSPGPSDAEGRAGVNGSADGTPQKAARGRPKDGTARKCANCGQVGHIKTNRKSVNLFFVCSLCGTKNKFNLENEDVTVMSPSKGKHKAAGGDGRRDSTVAADDYSTFQLLCPMLNGTMKTEDANAAGSNAFGASAAPLAL